MFKRRKTTLMVQSTTADSSEATTRVLNDRLESLAREGARERLMAAL